MLGAGGGRGGRVRLGRVSEMPAVVQSEAAGIVTTR